MVERERLEAILREQALSLSGLAPEERGLKVGRIVAAKLVVVGSVIPIGGRLLIVAKLIGTETSRALVEAALAESEGDLPRAVGGLARRLAEDIGKRWRELVAPTGRERDWLAEARRAIGGRRRLPTVAVVVPERHLGRPALDPATETELLYALKRCGFVVIEAKRRARRVWQVVDVAIEGEAVSERGLRLGDLVSCRGRVELRAIDTKTGRILAVERALASAVDVSEVAAAKKALQEAVRRVLPSFLKEMVANWEAARKR